MKRRATRILFLLIILAALTTIVPAPPRRPPPGPGESMLIANPVGLDPDDPGRRRLGSLRFRRGWQLTSPDGRFGGLSALHVENGQVTALTDSGIVMTFALPGASADRRVRFTPLSGPGSAATRSNRDTESLAVRGDRAWVGFERHNMIWRYRRSDWRAEAAARPAAMRGWRRNSGTESLVRLADGRFLAIAEGEDDSEFSEILLFAGDPAEVETQSVRLRYRRLEGFRPTDAALLPDGRLLVLNRRISLFGGMAAKLAVAGLGALEPNRIIESREIAELRSPLTVDNMEALSIAREGGRTIVRIASDDNYLALQRTLLLEFELDENASEPAG